MIINKRVRIEKDKIVRIKRKIEERIILNVNQEVTPFDANMYGIVEHIDLDQNVITLRTQVTRIYGVAGLGKAWGILESKGSDFSVGKDGLVVGGLDIKEYKKMKNIDSAVFICEGFGKLNIGEDIQDLLLAYKDKFVLLDGENLCLDLPALESHCMTKVKSTHLPIQDLFDPSREEVELKIGMRIRVIGNSYLGEQGKIMAVDSSETLIPSGITSILATIETEKRKIKIPVVNLEAIDYI